MHPIDLVAIAVQEAFEAQAPELVQFVQGNLSVPVVKAGKKRIRSKPGEHPRLDKGKLKREISASVTADGDAIRLELSSPTPYAGKLQEEMGRVIFSDVVDERGDQLLDAVVEAIQTKE